MLRRILCGLLLSACSFSTLAGYQLNGSGKINNLYIYPSYAVIKQGNVGGVANCTNSDAVSFHWSDFSPEVQDRILNTLLQAYAMKLTIELIVDDTNCGPEGFKKFQGEIIYH